MRTLSAAILLSFTCGINSALADINCDISAMLIQGAKKRAVVEKSVTGATPSSLSEESEYANAFAPGMREQLSALPSARYSPVETKKDRVTFGRKAMFSLRDPYGGMHQIEVTPLRTVSSKIHTLVFWKGPDNTTLLSTKLWITNGQNMLLGTEISEEMTLIVNVSIGCDK